MWSSNQLETRKNMKLHRRFGFRIMKIPWIMHRFLRNSRACVLESFGKILFRRFHIHESFKDLLWTSKVNWFEKFEHEIASRWANPLSICIELFWLFSDFSCLRFDGFLCVTQIGIRKCIRICQRAGDPLKNLMKIYSNGSLHKKKRGEKDSEWKESAKHWLVDIRDFRVQWKRQFELFFFFTSTQSRKVFEWEKICLLRFDPSLCSTTKFELNSSLFITIHAPSLTRVIEMHEQFPLPASPNFRAVLLFCNNHFITFTEPLRIHRESKESIASRSPPTHTWMQSVNLRRDRASEKFRNSFV